MELRRLNKICEHKSLRFLEHELGKGKMDAYIFITVYCEDCPHIDEIGLTHNEFCHGVIDAWKKRVNKWREED